MAAAGYAASPAAGEHQSESNATRHLPQPLQPTISLPDTHTAYFTFVHFAAGDVHCGPSAPPTLPTFAAANVMHHHTSSHAPNDAPAMTGSAAPALVRSPDSATAPNTAYAAVASAGAAAAGSSNANDNMTTSAPAVDCDDDAAVTSQLRAVLNAHHSAAQSVDTLRMSITRRAGAFRSLRLLIEAYFARLDSLDSRPLSRPAPPPPPSGSIPIPLSRSASPNTTVPAHAAVPATAPAAVNGNSVSVPFGFGTGSPVLTDESTGTDIDIDTVYGHDLSVRASASAHTTISITDRTNMDPDRYLLSGILSPFPHSNTNTPTVVLRMLTRISHTKVLIYSES